MDEETVNRDRFNWRLPLYSAIGGLILFAPIMFFGSSFSDLLYILVAAPIIGFALFLVALIVAIRGKRRLGLAVLAMVIAYWAVSWGLSRNSSELRSTARWLLWSQYYKAEVLAQRGTADGDLRHIEWDGRGQAGTYTIAYLVFDPTESLSIATKSGSPRELNGVPCKVYRVRRMESHYYTVQTYASWDRCHY